MSDKQIGLVFGMQKPPLSYAADERLVLPTTHLGMEFEFENVASNAKLMDDLNVYWVSKDDPSLHDKGKEFTFREPLFGKDVVDAVTNILKVAMEKKWRRSMRCGIHIHMDARDLSYPQLVGLILHYLIFEPAIYAWVGEHRAANNFCLPWFKTEGSLADAANLLRIISKAIKSGKYDEEAISTAESFHKYAGFNLRPLHDFGSVEFRHLETTTDFDRIIQWLNIPLCLKRAALQAPESSMVIIKDILNYGIRRTLNKTFEPKTVIEMLSSKNIDIMREIKEIGIPNAIELLSELEQNLEHLDEDWKIDKQGITHFGLERWQKRNFPKGVEDERKPPLPTVDLSLKNNPTFVSWTIVDGIIPDYLALPEDELPGAIFDTAEEGPTSL